MGNFCEKPENVVGGPAHTGLTVYGDYFLAETRAIMLMIQLGDTKHEFIEIDTFKGDHRKEEYLRLNATGSVPTITEGRYLLLGGGIVFLNYLVNHHKQIREKLYPLDFKPLIDSILLWQSSIMRVLSRKLIRMQIGPIAFGEK